jgi:hypothetical protein
VRIRPWRAASTAAKQGIGCCLPEARSGDAMELGAAESSHNLPSARSGRCARLLAVDVGGIGCRLTTPADLCRYSARRIGGTLAAESLYEICRTARRPRRYARAHAWTSARATRTRCCRREACGAYERVVEGPEPAPVSRAPEPSRLEHRRVPVNSSGSSTILQRRAMRDVRS